MTAFKNIRVLPSGYQVAMVRAGIEVSKHFAGRTEKSYRAATRYRDQLLRALPDKRRNKIPRHILQAVGLSKPVVGVYRTAKRKFYQVSYNQGDRKCTATFPWTEDDEAEAYQMAIEFRRLAVAPD